MNWRYIFIILFMLVSAYIGFLIGIFVSDNYNTRLAGLQEGFDKGFNSGWNYREGVEIRLLNQTLEKESNPENANWYLWAGYLNKISKSEDSDSVLEFNPYTIVISCRKVYPTFQIDDLKNVNPYTVLKSCWGV